MTSASEKHDGGGKNVMSWVPGSSEWQRPPRADTSTEGRGRTQTRRSREPPKNPRRQKRHPVNNVKREGFPEVTSSSSNRGTVHCNFCKIVLCTKKEYRDTLTASYAASKGPPNHGAFRAPRRPKFVNAERELSPRAFADPSLPDNQHHRLFVDSYFQQPQSWAGVVSSLPHQRAVLENYTKCDEGFVFIVYIEYLLA